MINIIEFKKTINYIEAEIIDQYVNDSSNRPWIVGFSGGKDSTMLLQLVWNAVKKVPISERTRHIYIISNDTLVENPLIVEFTHEVLAKIQLEARNQGIPITVHETVPTLDDTFWVNLIGRGYPAPGTMFRWCTERLKINPTTKFIKNKISAAGEVLILLGTRSDESANRARSMRKHAISGKRLRKHLLPNAYVYAPISDLTTEEVWQYLMAVPAPWGGKHYKLMTLYKNASGGDCPLVIDETTPSCGNSRFGCWVCTVIQKDKSMESLIDNGEEWLEPLSELRDFIAGTRENPQIFRSKVRRNGTTKDGYWGPYLPESRSLILKKLLEAQKLIQNKMPEIQLISHQELAAIQIIWQRDGIFEFNVSVLYKEIYPTNINMTNNSDVKNQEEQLLLKSCKDDLNDCKFIKELLILDQTKLVFQKKRDMLDYLNDSIENHLNHKSYLL